MRNEAHLEALKAAARLTMSAAMSVAVLGGCTAAAEESGDDAEKTESDVSAKKPGAREEGAKKKGPAVSDACHKDAGAPKLTCDQVLASAFPEGENGWFGNGEKKLSAEELACCTEEITASAKDGTGLNRGKYHWACCTATNWGQGIPDIGLACTPWGPPVPPAMNRAKKNAHPPVDAWMHQGVA